MKGAWAKEKADFRKCKLILTFGINAYYNMLIYC